MQGQEPTRIVSRGNNSGDQTIYIPSPDTPPNMSTPIEVVHIPPIDMPPITPATSGNNPTTLVSHSPSGRENATSDNDKTVIVRRPSKDDERTILVRPHTTSQEIQVTGDFIVGWLVAITGPMKGKTFSLGFGQNQIGRDPSNRICLPDDSGISRKGHVVVTYDQRRNRFSARPGSDGSGIADLNDELLEMPTQLKRGDTIRLSDDTTLRFVPFCDESFAWS